MSSVIRDTVKLGLTAFTRTPSLAASMAIARTMLLTAPFEVL